MPVSAPEESNPQIKQGIGPELPRPKPVKLLRAASWLLRYKTAFSTSGGRKPEAQQQAAPQQDEEQAAAQEETQLRDAFMAQQKARYGEEYASEDDEGASEQAALAQQFAQQQQQRYAQPQPSQAAPSQAQTALTQPQERASSPFTQPADANSQPHQDEMTTPPRDMPGFTLDPATVFDFSPMEDLVDDGPGEPLFTIAATPEPEFSTDEAQWQQPAQRAEPHYHSEPNVAGAAAGGSASRSAFRRTARRAAGCVCSSGTVKRIAAALFIRGGTGRTGSRASKLAERQPDSSVPDAPRAAVA